MSYSSVPPHPRAPLSTSEKQFIITEYFGLRAKGCTENDIGFRVAPAFQNTFNRALPHDEYIGIVGFLNSATPALDPPTTTTTAAPPQPQAHLGHFNPQTQYHAISTPQSDFFSSVDSVPGVNVYNIGPFDDDFTQSSSDAKYSTAHSNIIGPYVSNPINLAHSIQNNDRASSQSLPHRASATSRESPHPHPEELPNLAPSATSKAATQGSDSVTLPPPLPQSHAKSSDKGRAGSTATPYRPRDRNRASNVYRKNSQKAQYLFTNRGSGANQHYFRVLKSRGTLLEDEDDAIFKNYETASFHDLSKDDKVLWANIATKIDEGHDEFIFYSPSERIRVANDHFGNLQDDTFDAFHFPCLTIIFTPGKGPASGSSEFVCNRYKDGPVTFTTWLNTVYPQIYETLSEKCKEYSTIVWTVPDTTKSANKAGAGESSANNDLGIGILSDPRPVEPLKGRAKDEAWVQTWVTHTRDGISQFGCLDSKRLNTDKKRVIFHIAMTERLIAMEYDVKGGCPWGKMNGPDRDKYIRPSAIPIAYGEEGLRPAKLTSYGNLNASDLDPWMDFLRKHQDGIIEWDLGMIFKRNPEKAQKEAMRREFQELFQPDDEDAEFDSLAAPLDIPVPVAPIHRVSAPITTTAPPAATVLHTAPTSISPITPATAKVTPSLNLLSTASAPPAVMAASTAALPPRNIRPGTPTLPTATLTLHPRDIRPGTPMLPTATLALHPRDIRPGTPTLPTATLALHPRDIRLGTPMPPTATLAPATTLLVPLAANPPTEPTPPTTEVPSSTIPSSPTTLPTPSTPLAAMVTASASSAPSITVPIPLTEPAPPTMEAPSSMIPSSPTLPTTPTALAATVTSPSTTTTPSVTTSIPLTEPAPPPTTEAPSSTIPSSPTTLPNTPKPLAATVTASTSPNDTSDTSAASGSPPLAPIPIVTSREGSSPPQSEPPSESLPDPLSTTMAAAATVIGTTPSTVVPIMPTPSQAKTSPSDENITQTGNAKKKRPIKPPVPVKDLPPRATRSQTVIGKRPLGDANDNEPHVKRTRLGNRTNSAI